MNTVVEYLMNDASRYPSKTALIDEHNQISYREFWIMALRIGNFLKEKGIINQAVGVLAKRNVFTPIIFMGICCSGNFYVPLDPEMPCEKRETIIHISEMKAIITDTPCEIDSYAFPCDCFSLSNISPNDNAVEPNYTAAGSVNDPLSLIYTSGSTGTPKGVLKTHGAIIDFIEAFTNAFTFDEHEIIGNQTPFCFDASTKDLYLTLKLGATMVIIPTELFSFPVRLIEYMNTQKVTTILWVPSALSIVTQLNTFLEIRPETLKNVFFVGEIFPIKQLNKWREALPALRYVNLFGSTEIAGICCYYTINPSDYFENTDILPIGRPLKNCSICLVSQDQVIKTENTSGEIYIASNALAKEYYHDPAATNSAFIICNLDGTGAKRYFKTGDMAHYDPAGNLVFETRKDFQIKHMGHRIELGEIETAALALEEIEKCGCVYDSIKNKIILFCELKRGSDITGREIQSLLRSRLSSYMAPNKVIIIDKMLLNANGKIDRPALKKLI